MPWNLQVSLSVLVISPTRIEFVVCRVHLDEAFELSNQIACAGSTAEPEIQDLGYHISIPFVSHCHTMYTFRFHIDWGRGGYAGIDLKQHPIRPNQTDTGLLYGHLYLHDVELTVGNHMFEAIGFGNCCDRPSDFEVKLPGDQERWLAVNSGQNSDLVWPCPTS